MKKVWRKFEFEKSVLGTAESPSAIDALVDFCNKHEVGPNEIIIIDDQVAARSICGMVFITPDAK